MMKRMSRRLLSALLAGVLTLSLMGGAAAAAGPEAPVSLDGQSAPTYDYSDANQLPMTGYFSKTLTYEDAAGGQASREVYIYLSENASCRPYFYVIALPDGADPTQFLTENGWFDLAERTGECLFVLAGGAEGWGAPEEELPFLTRAMSWLNTPTADAPDPAYPEKNVNYWSAFGEWYFIGYGEGCAPLEAWAAQNPIFVIAQAYLDGQSAGSAYLDAVGAQEYPVGTNGYDISQDVRDRLTARGEGMILRGQVPVPTLFAGYDSGDYSIQYWQKANYCVEAGTADAVYGTVYAQSEDSSPWQTQYAGPISQVAVAGDSLTPQQVYEFLTYYTRYDNTSAYGNALMRRVDYSDVIVACHQSPDRYAEQTIQTPDGQTGTMICTVVEINGELREILFYLPDSAAQLQPNGAPIITVWAGGSQTNIIFFDSTCWWETANQNGVALIFANEAYNTSVAVSPKDVDACYQTMMSLLRAWEAAGKFEFDFTRVYSTGQSMGSMESQQFAQETPHYYAAVASTSFYENYADAQSGDPIPTYLVNGEGNGTDDTGTPFDDRWNRTDLWAQYFLTVNGFQYQAPVYDANGEMTQLGVPVSQPTESVSGPYDRFETYTWSNEAGIPIMQYTNSLYRPHNCLTSETPMLWDFLEHYSRDENGVRYYSASAFQEDDAVVIFEAPASDTWYDGALCYVGARGLRAGVTAFEASQPLTQDTMVQMLYHLAGSPQGGAAAWAEANDIAGGESDAAVTRGEAVEALYRLAVWAGYDVSVSGDLSAFSDADGADASMAWAVGSGLISGVGGGLLAPQDGATCGQFAVMITQFCQRIAQ